MTEDIYMQRCLELAKKGHGQVAPNPMVGSVIVHNNKIIGEGYHQRIGSEHAEVNAINLVKDKALLKQSTIYVSLEPCSHYGKTPPCAQRIIDEGIPRVVVAAEDTSAKISGKGIGMLENAGVEVKVGILKNEARELNKRFFTFHEKKRPYIILKWAQTLDGFIDKIRIKNTPVGPIWITNEFARKYVHKWRSEEMAILVGTNTAEKDNPALNVRSWKGNNPLRIVIDRNLRLDNRLNVFNKSVKTIVFNSIKDESNDPMLEYCKVPEEEDNLQYIFKELHKREITSIIIEGGAAVLQSCIDQNLWDESKVFTGNILYKRGVEAPRIGGHISEMNDIGNSRLVVYKNL